MSAHLTEQQQIEQLAGWWKNYGIMTLIVFLIALAAGMGYHYWRQHHEVKLERGSTHYEELLNAVVNDDDASAMKEANLLRNNYRHTPYAALATLMLARGEVYQQHYDKAEKDLSWVMHHANTDALKEVARLRAARLYIQEAKPQEALKLLAKINATTYIPLIDELKGDSYILLNQNDKARIAYQQALASTPHYGALRPILVMKRDNLAVNP